MSILHLNKLQNYFSEEKGWGWKWSRGPTNLQRQMAVTTLTSLQQENFPKGFFTSWIISSYMRWNSAHIWISTPYSLITLVPVLFPLLQLKYSDIEKDKQGRPLIDDHGVHETIQTVLYSHTIKSPDASWNFNSSIQNSIKWKWTHLTYS